MLILGISANFVLDFVHVALKGIIINAEVSSLKTSFSYEASLLLLAPTFVLLPPSLVTRASSSHFGGKMLMYAYDKLVFLLSPKSSKDYTLHRSGALVSLFLFTLLVLLAFYYSGVTFLSGDGLTPDCTVASYLATEVLPPSFAGFFFVRLVSRRLPPVKSNNSSSLQAALADPQLAILAACVYIIFYLFFLLVLTTDLLTTQGSVDTVASAALVCSFHFKRCFNACAFRPVFPTITLRQLSTVPNRDTSAASPASSEGTSVTASSSNSRTALDVAVPPLSTYRHLLMKRLKHPMLYDSEAKGILG